jgi:hypothetical protein
LIETLETQTEAERVRIFEKKFADSGDLRSRLGLRRGYSEIAGIRDQHKQRPTQK